MIADKPKPGDGSRKDSAGKDSSNLDGGGRMERGSLDGGGAKDAAKATEAGTQLLNGGGGSSGGGGGGGPSGKDLVRLGEEKLAEMQQRQGEIAARNEAAERSRREHEAGLKKRIGG